LDPKLAKPFAVESVFAFLAPVSHRPGCRNGSARDGGDRLQPHVLVPWLVLVGVVALEAGSALAVVLCRSAPARSTYIGGTVMPKSVTQNANWS
jgi:hypothetical protein